MLKVDRKKHNEFEEEYVKSALDAIAKMQPTVKKGGKKIEIKPAGGWGALIRKYLNDKRSVSSLSLAFKNLIMLYQKIEDYGLCEVMNLERLNPPIKEEDLKVFMKLFLLAEPETMRSASKHLKEKKGSSSAGTSDCSEDEFLRYFQSHAYESMCHRLDKKGVKLNVRIIQSLDIRVCPYCGCAYIGGRGETILGAQLDHFVNRSDYPFFALCLYNLIPSCGSCNLRKSSHDSYELISPLDEKAAFDTNIGIRLHSRPYVCITDKGKFYERRMEVKVLASKDDEMHDRYAANIEEFNLPDTYDYFEKDADEYVKKMVQYPKSQIKELAEILAMKQEGIEGWRGKTLYYHQLERALFLGQYAEGDKQVKIINSKMYTDLYRTYRKN